MYIKVNKLSGSSVSAEERNASHSDSNTLKPNPHNFQSPVFSSSLIKNTIFGYFVSSSLAPVAHMGWERWGVYLSGEKTQ